MTVRIERGCSTCRQVSGNDRDGQFILSVLAKRTYALGEGGMPAVADTQLPLQEEPEFDGDDILVNDTDLFPFKPRTDVVVKGHAWGYDGRRQSEASIQIGAWGKQIVVFGDRRCTRSATGKPVISSPEPITQIPLSYTRAYGGRDAVAEEVLTERYVEWLANLDPEVVTLEQASPFLYPRNPCGRGYLITASPAALEALRLPNLEDPLDLLTPERLEAGSPNLWPQMPLPQAMGWVGYEWFPRMTGVGLVPHYSPSNQTFAEVTRKYLTEDVVLPASLQAADAFHLTCGASLGLQLPHLLGGEPAVLQNIHPRQPTFAFQVPNERPRISTDGRKGKLNQTEPILHTVVIDADQGLLTLLWRGSAPALRPYLPEELERMPLMVEWP